MNTAARNRSVGITLRTALLSWLVALVTLLTFVAFIIPQQKRTFLENLESKAHGVAVSLRDVAAGAVVNEDFSTVVDHCKEMLSGDKVLDYLVITKNDGFSLTSDRTGWRSETNTSKEWLPDRREPVSGIGLVRPFPRRVFHYSQPFDYSGIQWGWIHVGLSLESYDRNVAMVHRRTGVLAVLCSVLSLLVSMAYARRLVQPILDLRQVVQKVASGDLSARATIDRGDELGSLACSVNAMTEALLRRDRILQSVRFAAQQFLTETAWQGVIQGVLAQLGTAAEISRIRVFENRFDERQNMLADLRHEWVDPDIASAEGSAGGNELTLRGAEFVPWVAALKRREVITANYRDLGEEEQRLLEVHHFKSVFILPIVVENDWWGILTLSDCKRERLWTGAERDSLRAAVEMLGAAIGRQRTQDALLEAKATLERRVAERTQELRDQVVAKERAHAELAEAQHRLVEASRLSGMAEVATGVLHNVGNVLNSVNVSAALVSDRLRHSKLKNLPKLSGMVQEHADDLGTYLQQDPNGRLIPNYLGQLSQSLVKEQAYLLSETDTLRKHIDHIREIVAMQQNYARVSGVIETVEVSQLVDDALQLNAGALVRHHVQVERDYAEVPAITAEKHKVLQILVNLIRNAKYALDETENADRRLVVRVSQVVPERVRIEVCDNGAGISPENLTQIFQHGFTTRKDGHGFGLHSGALAAKELGGSLIGHSDGVSRGATFVLELPVKAARPNGGHPGPDSRPNANLVASGRSLPAKAAGSAERAASIEVGVNVLPVSTSSGGDRPGSRSQDSNAVKVAPA